MPAGRGRNPISGLFGRFGLLGVALLAILLSSASDFAFQSQSGRPVGSIAAYNFPFTMGKPAAPAPWNPTSWDVSVHIRNNYQYGGIDAMQAGQGPACEAPPTNHPLPS